MKGHVLTCWCSSCTWLVVEAISASCCSHRALELSSAAAALDSCKRKASLAPAVSLHSLSAVSRLS